MGRQRHTEILGTMSIGRLLARMAIPSSIALFVMSTYNLVDAIFVGRGVGPEAIGALTVVLPFQMIIFSVGGLISMGSSSIVSRAFGSSDSSRVGQAVGTAVSVSVLVGICTLISGKIWAEPILDILGASGILRQPAREYFAVILFTEPIILFNATANAHIRAEGQANVAMATMIGGMVLNILLDPIFIIVLDLGVRGAALATLIGRSVSTLIAVVYFLSGKSSIRIKLSDLLPKAAVLKEMVTIGLSTFVQQAGSSIAALIRNNLLVTFGGPLFVSSFGAVFRIILFLGMPGMGIAQSVQPIAGFNYGARKYDRVQRTVWVSIGVCTVFMMIGFLLTQLFPAFFLQLFSSGTALLSEGIRIMRISAILFITYPAYIIAPSFYQALGKPGSALLLSLSRPVLGILLMILLVRGAGAIGVVAADPIAVSSGAVFALFYLRRSVRRIGELQEAGPAPG